MCSADQSTRSVQIFFLHISVIRMGSPGTFVLCTDVEDCRSGAAMCFFPAQISLTNVVRRCYHGPNRQTQCHFSWLVVSPLRQKSIRSGNLVLAGILAFYAVKTAPYPPLGLLATPNSALHTGAAPQASSWWTWAPAAHSLPVRSVPSGDSTQPSIF